MTWSTKAAAAICKNKSIQLSVITSLSYESGLHSRASGDANKLVCNIKLNKRSGLEKNASFPRATAVDPAHRTESA